MAFVKFISESTRRSYAPKATLSKSGALSFNHAARQRFGMDASGFAILYFDADTQRIGLELVKDAKAYGARRLRHRVTGSDLAAKAFANCYGISLKKTTSFPIKMDDESGFIVIDLLQGKARATEPSEKE